MNLACELDDEAGWRLDGRDLYAPPQQTNDTTTGHPRPAKTQATEPENNRQNSLLILLHYLHSRYTQLLKNSLYPS